VIIAPLLKIIFKRLSQPFEGFFQHVVNAVQLETARFEMARMYFIKPLLRQVRGSGDDRGIVRQLPLQYLEG